MLHDAFLTKLTQAAELGEVINRDGEDVPESVFDARGDLLNQLLPDLEKLLRLMVRAGAITVCIRVSSRLVEDITSGQYSMVSFDPMRVFENGNLWMDCASEPSGGTASPDHGGMDWAEPTMGDD